MSTFLYVLTVYTCVLLFVNVQIVKLIDYVHWLLSFIDHGKLIPIEEDVFVSIIYGL